MSGSFRRTEIQPVQMVASKASSGEVEAVDSGGLIEEAVVGDSAVEIVASVRAVETRPGR